MLNRLHILSLVILLQLTVVSLASAESDPGEIELYDSERFALGIGAAVVKFDSKIKFTDKQSGDSMFLDPEGNLDLPELSHVTTIYGAYSFNHKHSIGFSYFQINRESTLIDFDKNFDNVRIIGKATIADKTSFYRLDYAYTLFNTATSKIMLDAGIYGLDLKLVFDAEGSIAIRDTTIASDTMHKEAEVFAPLPMIGVNILYSFTPKWSMGTKVTFVGGSYEDVSANVLQTSVNARYRFTKHVGILFGLAYFDATVNIDDGVEETDITYGYNGGYIGMHFLV